MKNKYHQIKVIVCGEKWVAQQCLEFLYQHPQTEIGMIVTSQQDWQANLIDWGTKRQINVLIGNINDYLNKIAAYQPDFIFSIQSRSLLKKPLLQIPQRCINLHFGLLPRYGGCYPITWAILNGEPQAGVTLHEMNEKFDEGQILAQTAVPLNETTTARELFDSLSLKGIELFRQSYLAICEGSAKSYPQDLAQKLYYSQTSLNFEQDKIIKWHKTALEIQRQICAFSFPPFQFPISYLQGMTNQLLPVTITQTQRHKHNENLSPGTIKIIDKKMIVGTGNDEVIQIGLLNGQKPLIFLNSLGYSLTALKFVN
jgi:methionyl-tRNA formyltransferase